MCFIIGKNIEIFLLRRGEFIEEQKFSSSKFFERIKINPIKTESKYISFTHFGRKIQKIFYKKLFRKQ